MVRRPVSGAACTADSDPIFRSPLRAVVVNKVLSATSLIDFSLRLISFCRRNGGTMQLTEERRKHVMNGSLSARRQQLAAAAELAKTVYPKSRTEVHGYELGHLKCHP